MVHAHCMQDNEGYKHTQSGCEVIFAFPLQQLLHERTAMLRYTFIACLMSFLVWPLLDWNGLDM
jgi:hypothetical protein